MKCKDCPKMMRIGNTEETRQAICSVGNNWQPVIIDNECMYKVQPYTCKDCDHFDNDYACLTTPPDRPASKCGAFSPKEYSTLYEIAVKFLCHGLDCEKEFINACKEANEFYNQIPKE